MSHIVTQTTRSGRVVTIDLDKPRGVTRHQIKGLVALKAEQLHASTAAKDMPLTDRQREGRG